MLKSIRRSIERIPNEKISKKCSTKNSMNCSETSHEKAAIEIYHVKILGDAGKINTVNTTVITLERMSEVKIRLTHICADSMLNLEKQYRQEYISHLDKSNTYIVCDLTGCKKRDKTRVCFYPEDFLLEGIGCMRASADFIKEHMFFITSYRTPQTIRMPYEEVTNYITEFAAHNKRIHKIVSAFVQFHHAILFADKDYTDDGEKRSILLNAINGDGYAQYIYGSQFVVKNYMLYYLWLRESLKNMCPEAQYMFYTKLSEMDFDERTYTRLLEDLMDYGFARAANVLYELEMKKQNPRKTYIKKYIKRGYELGGLLNYFNYASECGFVLGRFKSLNNHEDALKGFEKFFECYNGGEFWLTDINYVEPRIHYMYYAYAVELDIGDEHASQHAPALTYYQYTLECCDEFDKKIFSIAKEFCEGDNVERDIGHGIAILELLNRKELSEVKAYVKGFADRLMKKRQYAHAEKCYEMLIEKDRSVCEKYLLAKMYRELEEGRDSNDQ